MAITAFRVLPSSIRTTKHRKTYSCFEKNFLCLHCSICGGVCQYAKGRIHAADRGHHFEHLCKLISKRKNTISVMYKEMIFETDVRTYMKADAA